MPIDVRPVRSRRELMRFIRLPWRLYRTEPHWVPPLISERKRHLDKGHNPFFEHAEAEYFLAWRDGQPVGRISAHVDHRLNEFHDTNWGLFGFFEAEENFETSEALLSIAEAWLRERGKDTMVGPMDFTTNHECGLLVEGFERRPQILENWHHPYYAAMIEAYGLSKAMDLYKWELDMSDREKMLPVLFELAEKVEPEHGITVRPMRKRNFESEVRVFALGVKPEYQHTGVAAKFYVEHFNSAGRTSQTWGEMGWILETNTAMNRGMEAMNGRIVKRYRLYEKPLAGGVGNGSPGRP